MSRKHTVALVAVLAAVALVGFLAPRLIEWFVGGVFAGGAAVVTAQRRRKKADAAHKENIAAEGAAVEELQTESDKLVEEADARAESDPQDAVADLSTEERRARLEEAAGKLK